MWSPAGERMDADDEPTRDASACPNCGADVIYGGVGRRPVWCSTRCRNDASLKRLGARRAAVKIQIVQVPRERVSGGRDDSSHPANSLDHESTGSPEEAAKSPTPTPAQALRILRTDPEAVGKLLSHLERRRVDGTLAEPQWLAVRNALRLIATQLGPHLEPPTHPD